MNPNGNIKHGAHGTLTYARWRSMMQRCRVKSASNYKYYGALGITVCDRWLNYSNFLADMSECPDKSLTLDRLDNSKGYEPGNCKWATQSDQNKNRRHCAYITYNGETKIMADWARQYGMSPNALAQRIYMGWELERALHLPLKSRTKK